MAKKISTSSDKEIRIKGFFVARTFISRYRDSNPLATEIDAEKAMRLLMQAGKIVPFKIVGLYPGLQAYKFKE